MAAADRLRALLDRPGLVVMPCCFDALSARLIERAGFEGLFSFRYSDRPGTAAAEMPDKVPLETAAERLTRLQARQGEITAESNAALVGRGVEVLVEGPAKRGRLRTGRTGTNKVVNFRGGPVPPGVLVPVLIEEAGTNSLRGRLLDG